MNTEELTLKLAKENYPMGVICQETGLRNQEVNEIIFKHLYGRKEAKEDQKNHALILKAEQRLFQLADILQNPCLSQRKQALYANQFNELKDCYARANLNNKSVVIPSYLLTPVII